jgi:hypothetical protein
MSIAIPHPLLNGQSERGWPSNDRSRLSDKPIVIVQAEIDVLRRALARLWGFESRRQDRDQHQQAHQQHQIRHVPLHESRRNLLRFAARVLCPASQFVEPNEKGDGALGSGLKRKRPSHGRSRQHE